MSKYNDTKFYWLQLKEDFFEEDSIEWLESQDNGEAYALFYLKLCLKSLKSNGLLYKKVGDMFIPYDAPKLARLTHTPVDTVKAAMVYLRQAGLVQFLENGEIYIAQVEKMIGSQSISAFKKQQQRMLRGENQKALPQKVTPKVIGGQKVDKCPPEIEIEKEIEIDKEKEIETKREIKKESDSFESLSTADARLDEQITELFNCTCIEYKKIERLTQKQKTALHSLLKSYNYDLNIFKKAFKNFQSNTFLRKNAYGWANFAWLIKPENFESVLNNEVKDYQGEERPTARPEETSQKALEEKLKAEGVFNGWDDLKRHFGLDEGK